jgi:ParB-like chromosome segregation protein Spo0J
MEATHKYQVMPQLSEEEYQALKEDIAENGVLVPVVEDADGTVIDGHHRIRAWAELAEEGRAVPSYPTTTRSDLNSDAEKSELAWRLNMQRRHLDRAQKGQAIAAKLRETPEWADNRIAQLLGVDNKTVRAVRELLERQGQIPKPDMLIGKDGKRYPRAHEVTKRATTSDDSEARLLKEERANLRALRRELKREREELAEEKDRMRLRIESETGAELNKERERFSRSVNDSAARQIAEYQARYNIPEIPEMFQSDPEAIQKAISQRKDERTREALEVLSEAMRLVGKMMRYEPEEAAERFLEWHDRDWAKENMERYSKWLTSCMEEINKQTSPGLRAVPDADDGQTEG